MSCPKVFMQKKPVIIMILIFSGLYFGQSLAASGEDSMDFNTDWSRLPSELYRDRFRIFVDRRAEHPEAYMVTNRLTGYVDQESAFRITPDGLVRDPESMIPEPLEAASFQPPERVEISGQWLDGVRGESSESNILGKDGSFLTEIKAPLEIPEAKTSSENLAYYGARLLRIGDTILFETDAPLPVAEMSMGRYYARDYLMNEKKGGGFYLEHHDRPHFHMPLNADSGGFLTLAKWITEPSGENVLSISAFRIPPGYAIYTGPHVIHNDGLLTGDYLVVYSVTENFSTVILRNTLNLQAIEVVARDWDFN